MNKKLLLLSNSSMPNDTYLAWATEHISNFFELNKPKNAIFIPYAGVGISYDEYTKKVNDGLATINIKVKGIHEFSNPLDAIKGSDAILVGGGNTFELLNQLYKNNLIELIREKTEKQTPYIGWSAGSNVACPTIRTTNDMPISFPESFNALNLVDFQINAHYTEEIIANHGGESRKQRLQEYLNLNSTSEVVCLPEGTLIEVNENSIIFKGEYQGKILRYEKGEELLTEGSILR